MQNGGFLCEMSIHFKWKQMQSWKQQPGQATILNALQKQGKSKTVKDKQENMFHY